MCLKNSLESVNNALKNYAYASLVALMFKKERELYAEISLHGLTKIQIYLDILAEFAYKIYNEFDKHLNGDVLLHGKNIKKIKTDDSTTSTSQELNNDFMQNVKRLKKS